MSNPNRRPGVPKAAVSDIIIVTDGDETAWHAVKAASESLGLTPLALSRGNPTAADADAIVAAAEAAPSGPVVVMVDDQGDSGRGPGERTLAQRLRDKRVRVLGVVAVASNTKGVDGVVPDMSVGQTAKPELGAVDKLGRPTSGPLLGDTVDVLRDAPHDIPVVGLGDPGKMRGHDRLEDGVPATRAALQTILDQRNS